MFIGTTVNAFDEPTAEYVIAKWKTVLASQPKAHRYTYQPDSETPKITSEVLFLNDGESHSLMVAEMTDKTKKSLTLTNRLYTATITSNNNSDWLVTRIVLWDDPEFENEITRAKVNRFWAFTFGTSIDTLLNCERSGLEKRLDGNYEINFYDPSDGIETIRVVTGPDTGWMPVSVKDIYHEDSDGLESEMRISGWHDDDGQQVYSTITSINSRHGEELARCCFKHVELSADILDRKECYLSHYGLPEPPVKSKYRTAWFIAKYVACVGVLFGILILFNYKFRGT